MILRVRLNRVLRLPDNSIWATGGQCVDADMNDPVLGPHLRRRWNRVVEVIDPAHATQLIPLPPEWQSKPKQRQAKTTRSVPATGRKTKKKVGK